MSNWRSQCIERLLSVPPNPAALLGELRSIVQELGFDYCSYVLRQPIPLNNPSMLWSSNYPAEWLRHYEANNYLAIDPTVQQAAARAQPVVWDSGSVGPPSAFWEEARSFGICHGWTLLTRGPRAATGLLSLARSHEAISAAELDDSELKLVWLAHQIHGMLDALELQPGVPDGAHQLTEREREVLRWGADGKTADETGTILGITERTVTYHVTLAMCKLGVTNKTQAVAKALLLKLI
ncbi:MAG: LuxR family transcriptional regulator [Rhodanobacteraceae bacterium]|nr:MAG: LuxR family transcriptional regulator [Rhodanobacteraceae bacterium]